MQDDYGDELPHPSARSLASRIDKLEAGLAENTESTKRIEDNTSELIDILNGVKSAFKVLTWIGKIAKPVSAIIGLCLGLWGCVQALKAGVTPE